MQTLLLADDSVTIQRVIELTFADEDIQVVAVSDGDAAIARLEAAPPDIVLVDVGMPGKSGYEVAGYVKASPKLGHIPVMLLTGAFEPIDQEKAKRAGCDGVLAKPFEPQFVISRVKELLARRRATPAVVDVPRAAPAGPATPEWSAPIAVDPEVQIHAQADVHKVATRSPEVAEDAEDYFDRLDAAFADLSAAQSREGPSRAIEAPPLTAPDVDRSGDHAPADSPEFQVPQPERWDIAPSLAAGLSPPVLVPVGEPASLSVGRVCDAACRRTASCPADVRAHMGGADA